MEAKKQKKNAYMKEYLKNKRKELKELKEFEELDKEHYTKLINERDDKIERLKNLNQNFDNETKYKEFYQLILDKKNEEIEELAQLLNQLKESKKKCNREKTIIITILLAKNLLNLIF